MNHANLFSTFGVGYEMGKRRRNLLAVAGTAIFICASLSSLASLTPSDPNLRGPYRTLIVGGGPDLKHNQVAIESNVRYVWRLLPTGASSRILFTNGDPNSQSVLCDDGNNHTYYRAPRLPRLDGPAGLTQINSELAAMASDASANPTAPEFLYFTGHGSPNPGSRYNNNNYDLWDNHYFTVKNLATSLKSFPKETPITLVMVECFSGAFGNILFEEGDPASPLADTNICGFFASIAPREAAGCTSEVNEANYRDFTSYFFAALTGIDRLGKPVTGADYNQDGKIGMNEAFAYSLIHDDSIDTPVCTSDVFLRKFIETKDDVVMETPFSDVRSWASPSQLAALKALSTDIGLTDEDAPRRAYRKFMSMDINSMDRSDVRLLRFVRLAKSVVLAHTLQTTGSDALKARFAALMKLESGNPFR